MKLLLLATVAHNQQLRLPLFPLKELSGSVTTGSTTKRLQRNSFETLSVWAGRQVSLGEGKRWSKRKAERSSSAIGCSVAMLHWLLQKHLNARESMNEKPGCTQNLIISTYTQTLTLQCYTTEAMQLRHKSPSNNIWQQHGGQAGYQTKLSSWFALKTHKFSLQRTKWEDEEYNQRLEPSYSITLTELTAFSILFVLTLHSSSCIYNANKLVLHIWISSGIRRAELMGFQDAM